MISNKIIAKESFMELVYLWVDKYKNIDKQGFNFSPRFRCEFKDGILNIDENKHYVSIFPDNINITAIVGENGSGKSSILFSILEEYSQVRSDGTGDRFREDPVEDTSCGPLPVTG